jgi:hypothetical protein
MINGSAHDWLEAAAAFSYENLKHDPDLYSVNIRFILDSCFPGIGFDDQMRRTWITNSVLCSAPREGGRVPVAITRECRYRYLDKQLALFPSAIVVALGAKATDRMRDIPGVVVAASASPPGCNFPEARPSWAEIARLVRSRGVSEKPSFTLPKSRSVSSLPHDPIISTSQLADLRRNLISLLNVLDQTSEQLEREGLGARIGRLQREHVIPREIGAMMRTITEMRNVTEYESRVLSNTASAAVKAAWAAIQEWAQNRRIDKWPK